jgi:hypothetical protein
MQSLICASGLTHAAAAQLDSLLTCLQETNLHDGHEERRLKINGRAYTTKAAYAALITSWNHLLCTGATARELG